MRSRIMFIGFLALALMLGGLFFIPKPSLADDTNTPVTGVGAGRVTTRTPMGPGAGADMMASGVGMMNSEMMDVLADLPPEVVGLLDGSQADRFSRFTGASMTLKSQNGQAITVVVTPGVVASLGQGTLALTPNDGSAAKSFTVSNKTTVQARPERGSFQAVAVGDRVVVVTLQGTSLDQSEALLVSKVSVTERSKNQLPRRGETGAATATPAPM